MGQTSSHSGGSTASSKHFRGGDFKSSTTSHSTPGPSQYQSHQQAHHVVGSASGVHPTSMEYCGDELLEQDEGISCLQPRGSYVRLSLAVLYKSIISY